MKVNMLKQASNVGESKIQKPLYKQLMLAFLAGAFIAFAAEGANMAAFNFLTNPDTYGLGRAIAGMVFGVGLMLVIIAGGELFSGNMLMVIALLDKKIDLKQLLKNWFFVYWGNFVGAMFIVLMIVHSGLLNSGEGLLGGFTIKLASNKVSFSFFSALILGIMCNWLVCLAVWMGYAAKDIVGKMMTMFFVIGLFVISGFEHCIANMYYIPAGILAKSNIAWVEQSSLSLAQLDALNWNTFFINNLLPVTLGNMIGGALLVGCFYWIIYREQTN